MARNDKLIRLLVDSAIQESKLAALTNKDADTRVVYIGNAIRYLTDAKEEAASK